MFVFSFFRQLQHRRDSNMESMDISYSDDKTGEETDMICDEEQHECSDHENIVVQQLTHNGVMIELDSHNAPCDESSRNINAQSVNTLLNSSFPTEHSESVPESVRFPLQDAKDCNQFQIIPRNINSIERMKENLMTTVDSLEICGSDKENMFTDTCEARLNEFPIDAKREGCVFPLEDALDFAAIQSFTSNSSIHGENFTPANEYNFSAADFDCLLSRGCSQTSSSTVKSALGSASSSSNLPRNSVLDNFDPLLRRQTIVKAEHRSGSENVEGGPSAACLALVNNISPLQESNRSAKQIPACRKIDADRFDGQQVDSALLLLNTSGGSSLIPLLEHQTGNDSKDKQDLKEISSCLDDTAVDPNCSANPETSHSSLEKTTITTEDNGTSDSSKCSENLLFSTSADGQQVIEYERVESNEPLVAILDSVQSAEHVPLNSTDSQKLSELNLSDSANTKGDSLSAVQFQELNIEGALPAEKAAVELIAESTGKLNSTVIYTGTPNAHDDLTFFKGNMIAEPITEKQNSAVKNMSDDRSVSGEEGYAEVGKKCKTEEVNFADIEKKMLDIELREENMLKRITEKDKTISKMSNVVEAYERTIAELISEKEILIRNHEEECENLKQDNEINAQHLESLEQTFSNLYTKYERMKKNAIKYKENEDKLLEKVMKLEECLRAQEQRYEKMKSHAMSQLEIANTKIDEAIRNHSQEVAKLKAQIKKEEVYRISINEQLIQKSKENEQLVKICDELISETN
ncbi:dentin sialophosphoprotein [Anopheles maculipalpis]|uniref:dentin sialophosphoprotein n=1 Tax=Anopheles maculipalpis TaxID=1496333 RepID=UPI0021590D53|nr:dentin sialophosphoprotein [Anopheles maculipalpis]